MTDRTRSVWAIAAIVAGASLWVGVGLAFGSVSRDADQGECRLDPAYRVNTVCQGVLWP